MRSKIILILVVIIGLCRLNLFSLITSRIEGTVADEETGLPIEGAEVYLVHDERIEWEIIREKEDYPYEWEQKTSKNGYFRYDNLIQSEYFIWIYKEGYATVGPFQKELVDQAKAEDREDTRTIHSIKPGTPGLIHLNEGEIKHFKIKLTREAVVEVHYIMKTTKGEGPLPPLFYSTIKGDKIALSNIEAILYISVLNQRKIYPSKKDIGLVQFNNLGGGALVKVEVMASGYPHKTYEVQLEKGKTSIVNHILDYSVGPVIHGVIKDKTTGEFMDFESVALTDSINNHILTETNDKGEYWLGGFQSGYVTVRVHLPFKRIKDIINLNITQNEIRELNLEY
ncbi:MAG TPA: carboxypeptidase-like regulatory domain-containing protein [Candidatus Kapabacteria bacterium]|nr:carboxypeptidase-like regulatory domain-containing protein [Candidatus Kapabacteria bacterium]